MTPSPSHSGQAPSELALNSAGRDAVVPGEQLADGGGDAGVGDRGGPAVGADRLLVDHGGAVLRRPARSARLDLPEPATPVSTVSTPAGMSTVTCRRLLRVASVTVIVPVAVRGRALDRTALGQGSAGGRARAPELGERCPGRRADRRRPPAPGPISMTWSARAMTAGSCSTTRTLLPLSRSCSSSWVIDSTSVRVQSDGGLVEHVEHLGEAGPQVLHGLDALRLAAGQGGGGAGQA